MLPFLSFYPLIDSENKVAPSRAKFYTTIQKGREDGRRLTYKISLAAVQYYHPLQSSTYKNRTCHHQLGRRQLATKATHLCQRQRQLYVFPLPVTIFQHMFNSGDSLAETSWITTSIGFRVYAEDHRRMEASFGCQKIWVNCKFYHLPRFSFHALQHPLHWLSKDCVIHHGDHEQFRLTLFCPQLYFQGALNTWEDPELFEQLPNSPQEAQLRIQQAFPTYLVRKYSWGFRKKATLPYGFVPLKRKKNWQKGPTLICYFQSYQSTLLKAVSRG